jgi:hypothetical protein
MKKSNITYLPILPIQKFKVMKKSNLKLRKNQISNITNAKI